MSARSSIQSRTWSQGQYSISSDWKLIPIDQLNAAFASDDLYWAAAMPEDVLRETLENSLSFGLYDDSDATAGRKLIGYARCITDFTTFLYLTDVYVWPEHQGKGLGKWLITCIQSVIDDMPHLRRSMLFTSNWEQSVPLYEKLMEMEVLECKRGQGAAVMQHKGPALLGNSFV